MFQSADYRSLQGIQKHGRGIPSASCSLVECLAAVIGGSRQLEIAQSLVSRFGSAQAIARATHDEIVAVEGIGPTCAVRLRAALEFSRLLSMPDERNPPMIQSPEDAAALLLYPMQKLEQEHMLVLLLNTRNRLIGEPVEVYHGSLNANLIRVSELLRPAVMATAASIILAHNHPSGDPTASPDVALTRAIAEAGKMLDIEVLDHIIFGGSGRFISMKSRGLGFN